MVLISAQSASTEVDSVASAFIRVSCRRQDDNDHLSVISITAYLISLRIMRANFSKNPASHKATQDAALLLHLSKNFAVSYSVLLRSSPLTSIACEGLPRPFGLGRLCSHLAQHHFLKNGAGDGCYPLLFPAPS